MKKIRINFTDFWKNFDPENNSIYKKLVKNYTVVLSENPDYLFFSCYGYDHLKYDCIKIFYTGENVIPDFNFCDYAIGFHYLNFSDRYRRIPLFSSRESYKGLLNKNVSNKEKLLNRKFCNFLYSNKNNAHPIRKKFFERLSKYKRVDSGGGYLNNLGYRVDDKNSFLSEYKFTIAFENSVGEGYTTEKLVDPMSVNSLPVYWGNPWVERDFNTSSFIRLKDSSGEEIEKAVKKIVYLDQHDDEYLEMLNQPWLLQKQFIRADKIFEEFLTHIFSIPQVDGTKRPRYGYNKFHTLRLKSYVIESVTIPEPENLLLKKLKKIYRRISRYIKQ